MLSNKKLIIEEIKRKNWVLVILMLIALVTGPLLLLLSYENWASFLTQKDLIEAMENQCARSGGMGAVLCIVSAVLLGLAQFSYLFSKNKVDLYHSIPVKRSRRFVVNYVSGCITFLACCIVSNILMLALCASKGCFTGTLVSNLLLSFCSEIVHFLYFYNITIIAVMLTGNIVVCIAGIFVLSLFYYFSTELINGLRNYYFVTTNSIRNHGAAFWNKIPELSPVTSYFSFNERRLISWGTIPFESNLQAYGYLLKVVVIVILTCILAFYLFEKRPSEAAGKAMAFKKSQPYIRIPVVLVGGLFGAAIMTSVVNAYKNGWVWFGLISGIVLTHCVMEIIYNLNFRAIVNNKLQLLISVVAGCLILFIFQTDVLGYDKYLPDRDKIESAGVAFIQLDQNLSCNTLKSMGDGIWVSTGKSTDEQVLDNLFTDSVMIDKIYGIGTLGVSCVDNMIARRYGENNGRYYEEAVPLSMAAYDVELSGGDNVSVESDIDINKREEAERYFEENNITLHEIKESEIEDSMITDVIFRLKNGRTVIRRYQIPVIKLEMAMNEIYKTKSYKKVHFDLYDALNKGAISAVEAYDAFDSKKMVLSGGQMKQFMEIYISELEKLTVEDLKNSPIGRVSPKFQGEYYEESLYGYYLYPCFTKTLEYMQSVDVDMTHFTNEVDVNKVQNMIVNAYNLFEKDTENESVDKESVFIDNVTYSSSDEDGKAMIEEVSKYLRIRALEETNQCLTPYDGRIDVQMYYESENGIQIALPCVFKIGEMPQELINDLMVRVYEQESGFHK